MSAKALADEIDSFLLKHGKRMPDDENEWTSPDAAQLELFSKQIRAGVPVDRVPWSEWSGGGYKPWMDQKARDWHDAIIEKCEAYFKQQRGK